jgi:hypothetical protein
MSKFRLLDPLTDRNRTIINEELDLLHKRISDLTKAIQRLQFAPCEDSCEEHEPTDEDDEHNRSCVGCGRYQCQRCLSTCWITWLLKGNE